MPALLVLLCGCAGIPENVRDFGVHAPVELTSTPFFPQERLQCGPAALTTALVSSGVNVALADIERKVFLAGRGGSLQVEMLAGTRTSGRLPYVIDGTLSALSAELAAGRPVIVLQNLGVAAIPRWHYAVVVGVDPGRDEIVLRSGTEPRRITRTRTFLNTWRRSRYWAMVVIRPGEMPANVQRHRYFEAVAALEQAGRLEEARIAWQAAVDAWPASTVAAFGLANAYFAAGHLAEAEQLYLSLLERDGALPEVRNNLAMVLAAQGRFPEAMQAVDAAIAQSPDPVLLEELEHTRATIRGLSAAGPTDAAQ